MANDISPRDEMNIKPNYLFRFSCFSRMPVIIPYLQKFGPFIEQKKAKELFSWILSSIDCGVVP
jgi:hypothetical protein